MWQRFTERARRVVFFAQEEAAKENSRLVETEHLLLGIIAETDNVAGRILDCIGVKPAAIRTEIRLEMARRAPAKNKGTTELSPLSKRAIDLSYEEARHLNNNYIGSEHLLLGLIREESGIAGKVLAKLGADLSQVRAILVTMQDNGVGQTTLEALSESKEESLQQQTNPGDLGIVQTAEGRDVVEMASNLRSFIQLLDAFRAHDVEGYHELFADPSEPMLLLPSGTPLRVLVMPRDADTETHRFGLHVRILDGEYAGRAGIIRREAFHFTGTDDTPFPPPLQDER